MNSERVRNFAFIIYDDSAPKDWKSRMGQLFDSAHYICHDKDINPDGTKRKLHYHVLVSFDNARSWTSVLTLASAVGASNNMIQKVSSLRGYARYLCHLDNPEKYRYDIGDVVTVGSGDYYSMVMSESGEYKVIKEILEYVKDNNIEYYCDLLDYASKNNSVWFNTLCKRPGRVILDYIKSSTYKIHGGRYKPNLGL